MSRSLLSLLRVALVDLRGGLASFWILVACIALGVATVATVGSVGASLQAALARDARMLLGGDIELRLTHRPADEAELALFDRLGRVSAVTDLLGRVQSDEASALAAVRAIDSAYPLLGTVEIEGDGPLMELFEARGGVRGVLVAPLLLDRLGVTVGDRIGLGAAEFEVRGVLLSVPDQTSQGIAIGYPVLMAADGLADTGLVQPGGLARYRYKIDFAPGMDADRATQAVDEAFPDAGWRVSLPGDATEELARYLGLLRRFLTVVGLSALLVGGVGVAHAVSAYVTDRQRSIATMKALGATRSRVMGHFLTQILVLTAIGIVLGIAIGGAFTLVALPVLAPLMGIALVPIIDLASMASSIVFGLLTGFIFAYLPLNRAQSMSPAQLFRSAVSAAGGPAGWRLLLQPQTSLPILAALAGLFAVAVIDTGRPEIVFWYAMGAIVAFLVLRGAAYLLKRGLMVLPPARGAVLRNAVKSIYRPGSPAASVILSLGLGVALLLVIALVQTNLRHQLDPEMRVDSPDFIYMDLFEDEVAAFEALATTDERIAEFIALPLVRASSFTINGEPPPELKEPPRDLTLYFGDEQPLTYSAAVPSGSEVASGAWWPSDYSGPPLVSVSEDLRALLGLELGDEMTFLIFGEPISATVANFRNFAWQRGGVNFPYVLSPGSLAAFPVSYFGLVTAQEGTVQELQSDLVAAYPELVFLPVEEAIEAVRDLMGTVNAAISTVGAVALASGVLVLAGAVAAGRRQREADAIIAKVLGATRADLLTAFVIEYGLVGGLAAALAVLLGSAGAWAFVSVVLQTSFSPDPILLAVIVPTALGLTIGAGAVSTWNALSSSPATFLRQV